MIGKHRRVYLERSGDALIDGERVVLPAAHEGKEMFFESKSSSIPAVTPEQTVDVFENVGQPSS